MENSKRKILIFSEAKNKVLRKAKVLILGGGKIGQSLSYYLKRNKAVSELALFCNNAKDLNESVIPNGVKIIIGDVFDEGKTEIIKNYDILIGALPEKCGRQGLKLALKYKKDLIDVSVVPASFYSDNKKNINEKGITVIPGCGVSPGLVNLFVGFEMSNFKETDKVEIGAGTLPLNKEFFFPFTWSFQDLIEEHLENAVIIKNGKKITLQPFSGYRKESLGKTGEAESYLIEEWSTLPYSLKLKNIDFRVIRPLGFFHFFQYLKNYSFFEKKNINLIQGVLTKKKEDNITMIYVKIKGAKDEIFWRASSFSKKNEKFNSMQKITSLVPSAVLRLLLEGKINQNGLIFMEEIGGGGELFKKIINELKKNNIFVETGA
jgi:lysine 6-dehydrogenase